MPSRIRLTTPVLYVLGVLAGSKPGDPVWGFRLSEETGLGSGTVYPLLERLERAGWVTSFWEDPPPPDRPRRRFYELTGVGRQEIAAVRQSARGRRLGAVGLVEPS